MESLTRCPCCLRRFTAGEFSPLILHCGHTCCQKCIEKIAPQMGALSCPLCGRLDYRKIANLKKNIIVLELLEENKPNCLAPCVEHSDTESLYYCISHMVPLCFRCLSNHKRCDFYDIRDSFISLNTQDALNEVIQRVCACLNSLKENRDEVNRVISQIEHKRLTTKSVIDHAFQQIEEALANKKKELLQGWDFPFLAQVKEMRLKASELDSMIAKTEFDLSEVMNISISASRIAGFEKLSILSRLECYSSYEVPTISLPECSQSDIKIDISTILSEINSLPLNQSSDLKQTEFGMTQLVNYLSKSLDLSERIINILETTDRKDFIPTGKHPYQDSAQEIGFNTVISSPTIHAQTLHVLDPFLKEGCKVLDLACGSGYLTLCFAKSIGSGTVYGVDHIEEVLSQASENILKSWNLDRILLVAADARNGLPDFAPFDVIHLGAASSRVPDSLVEQLRPGGVLLAPIGPSNAFQVLKLVKKNPDGSLDTKDYGKVKYSSLGDRNAQCPQSFR